MLFKEASRFMEAREMVEKIFLKKELVSHCKHRGVPASGTKEDLIRRLFDERLISLVVYAYVGEVNT